ncbi:MAG: Transcriptional regulator [Bradyrhizobium sp.]|nr:Transcriptional regulator [Bradyrhizobium sp.]
MNMRTLGPQTAKLVTGLQDESRTIFTVDDAVRIVGSPRNLVSNMLGKAERRGVVTRLRRGTYTLVPFELGSETTYAGDPLVVADRLMGDREHFLSHGTALAVHGMTTQPRLLVTVSAVAPPSPKIVAQGTEIRTVSVAPDEIFGTTTHWTNGRDKVSVSDRERTILDCLRRPDLCGGYIEVDVGAWMVRDRLDATKLVDYAIRLDIGSVISRVGYLLDSCRIGTDTDRKRLANLLTKTYHLLDPSLSAGGRYDARWRLRLNVEQSEIEAVRNT